MSKIKTYVLMVSRTFPATHPRKGEETFFIEKIRAAIEIDLRLYIAKLHTIRGNYKLWEKRIKAVQEGKAILSLRYWTASPYNSKKDNSKQQEFARLDKDSGIGIQKLKMYADETSFVWPEFEFIPVNVFWDDLAKNDGLSLKDFKAWFQKYDMNKSFAIIHFTKFRY